MLVVQSIIFKFVEVPENLSYWNNKKETILKAHNWSPDSFPARQFEQKLTSGEIVGFFNSPNSFAAMGVLLFFAAAGIGIQKLTDREPIEWIMLSVVAVLSLIWILIVARSKTSAATPFIGVGILASLGMYRRQLAMHHRGVFLTCAGAIVFLILAVAGHGVYHHGLFPGHFSNSLDFRWKYWVASAHIFAEHPWVGVGWSNFGLYYLAHRLPEAAEEIKDPHNFLIRFFVELGVVGGALCIAWLTRLAWELTQPASDLPDTKLVSQPFTIRSVVAIVLLGMLLSVIANTDFSLSFMDTLSLLMKPILFLLALVLSTIAAAMLSPHQWVLDDRPAPWIFYSTLTGLGLFLLHNLIDFSWFEAGAMFTFMALIGSAQGIAGRDEKAPISRAIMVPVAVTGVIALAGAALFFVTPILIAEQSVLIGNEMIRTASGDQPGEAYRHFKDARDAYAAACALVPYNADYLYKHAEAAIRCGDLQLASTGLADARRVNPLMIDAYLLDANLQLQQPAPDVSAVRSDFQTVVRLNPNDVSLHVQFGRALDRFGLHAEAQAQFQAALNADAALPPGEPKRLSVDQVQELKKQVN